MSKLDALLKYHDATSELDRLEAELRSSDAHKKLSKLHGFLKDQQTQISALQKQVDLRTAAVSKLQAQFTETQKQYDLELSELAVMEQDEDCTAEEMTESRRAIEKLLEQLTTARRDLYDTLNYIEKATVEYKETYSKAGKAKKEFDAAKAECEAEEAGAESGIAAAKAEIARLEKDVDPALLKRYQTVKGHHAVPVARVANNQCGGCNMSLPTAVVKRVAAGVDVVECENCGRILYYIE